MGEETLVTVKVTDRLSAQGPLIKDHGDGTATVDAGLCFVTGRIVKGGQEDTVRDRHRDGFTYT